MSGDIPEGAHKIAADIMDNACLGELWAQNGVDAQIRADIARALLAERERAARIAETLGVHPHLNVFAGGPEWYKHGQVIAAAIRRGQG